MLIVLTIGRNCPAFKKKRKIRTKERRLNSWMQEVTTRIREKEINNMK